jgi:hypothetical protein
VSKPSWLHGVQEFCRKEQIEIAAWGENALVVTARSPEIAERIAAKLAPLGFTAIADESDSYAGLLTLSHSSAPK